MKKHTVIHLLGGNESAAAAAIGCTKQAVNKWKTDAHGNIVSRRVADMVLGSMVRANAAHRKANPEGERFALDDATLDDLMYMPANAQE